MKKPKYNASSIDISDLISETGISINNPCYGALLERVHTILNAYVEKKYPHILIGREIDFIGDYEQVLTKRSTTDSSMEIFYRVSYGFLGNPNFPSSDEWEYNKKLNSYITGINVIIHSARKRASKRIKKIEGFVRETLDNS